MNADEMRALVVRRIEAAPSLRKLAASWGVSPSYLVDLRLGRRDPGPAILKHFGLRRVVTVTYEPDHAPAQPEAPR